MNDFKYFHNEEKFLISQIFINIISIFHSLDIIN